MKRFAFVTIHPQIFSPYLEIGVYASARKQIGFEFIIEDLRQYAVDRHSSVDASPYGGGDGMVMRPEPLAAAVKRLKGLMTDSLVILLTPQGEPWKQSLARKMIGESKDLIFICGRFAGIDQRFIDLYVDREISLGDFVLAGGELAALSVGESLLRFLPGVLGNRESSHFDSFAEGYMGRLEPPQYTRPPVFENQKVPEVLLSGNHQAISKWRELMSERVTKIKRPDIVKTDS